MFMDFGTLFHARHIPRRRSPHIFGQAGPYGSASFFSQSFLGRPRLHDPFDDLFESLLQEMLQPMRQHRRFQP